ncbi:MAG: lipoate--protein ligase family protein [Candidatus Bathyarchaeota archaeon]|nr:lipoate--protein ligase family protein [Candidatus Bathyarchaeota archaeon]
MGRAMEEWRLLDIETPDRAAMNLAIEEAIFIGKAGEKGSPTVRFWRNRKAAVVGYSQNVETEVDLEVCRREGVEVVRRFSGGGAVFQDLGNLNYSIAIDADHPIVKGFDVSRSYKRLTLGVIEGLRSELRIDAVFDPPSDILVRNGKISGNAQSRRKGVIFHQGTLLVKSDLVLLTKVLNAPESGLKGKRSTSKRRRVTNLADEMDRRVTMREVKGALWRGFENAFSVKMAQGMLTSDEKKRAQKLYDEKYLKKEWNFWR